MTIQKLYKQFVESVTKWKANNKTDEFFSARVKITFYYSLTAVIILGASSVMLYNTILSNLNQSILDSIPDVSISQAIVDIAQDILLNRFLTIDILIIFLVVVLGFLLTRKTLAPIKANMQKQKRFIADASHELRTPIAVIISGLEVNLNNKNLTLESAKKTMEDTLSEMREFSKLSSNLLDISKYDTPIKTEYEPIKINELLKSIIEKNKIIIKDRGLKIETRIDSDAVIDGNKIELERVFYNILDNAIKYNKTDGNIFVSDKVSLNKYIVTISDDGCGISKDIINKIFDSFFRGDISRNTAGAGLGLTISKKIIENHKGTISIKSQENKGTSVIISLPISS